MITKVRSLQQFIGSIARGKRGLPYNYGEGAKARRLWNSSMDMVSERFILEYEVRDSIFFLSMIACVLCVKCGRVCHSLSKDYSLFCLVFSVRFGICFFAVYNKGMLFAFVNEHSSPVKRNSFINTLGGFILAK